VPDVQPQAAFCHHALKLCLGQARTSGLPVAGAGEAQARRLRLRLIADRLAGARRALRRSGLQDSHLTVIDTAALTIAEGRHAGQRVVGLPARRRPSAVFCANDLLALGFLQQMTQHEVVVPDEMAIVGYDDIEFAGAAAVPLTSVRQPRHELGRRAAELLLEEAAANAGRAGGHVHQQVQFTPELIVRASSGRRLTARSAPRPA
jgi:LacI family transcriptional regulator